MRSVTCHTVPSPTSASKRSASSDNPTLPASAPVREMASKADKPELVPRLLNALPGAEILLPVADMPDVGASKSIRESVSRHSFLFFVANWMYALVRRIPEFAASASDKVASPCFAESWRSSDRVNSSLGLKTLSDSEQSASKSIGLNDVGADPLATSRRERSRVSRATTTTELRKACQSLLVEVGLYDLTG